MVYTKADKGNIVIALNKSVYVNKTLEVIETGNYTI